MPNQKIDEDDINLLLDCFDDQVRMRQERTEYIKKTKHLAKQIKQLSDVSLAEKFGITSQRVNQYRRGYNNGLVSRK